MSLFDKILQGKVNIGYLGYSMMAYGYRFITGIKDSKRLRKQCYDSSDLEIQKNIRYMDDRSKYHLLDIYHPKRKSPFGTIMVIHGGGLMDGDKDLNRYSNMELCRRGYDVVAISYSLLPRSNFETQISECLNALHFIMENQERLHLNLSHFYLFGDSAGGLLSLQVAGILKERKYHERFHLDNIDISIQAIGLVSSMSKLKREDNLSLPYQVAKIRKISDIELAEHLSDATKWFDKHFPPCILSTSDGDMLKEDSIELCQHFSQNKFRYEFNNYEANENRLNHVFLILYPLWEESQDFFNRVDHFFHQDSIGQ